jgi:AraC family transcriptional regulator
MCRSEVLAREVATGELVDFGNASIGSSSANAAWRDLIRVEQHGRPPFEIEHTLVWDTIIVHRGPGTLEQHVGGGPLQKIIIAPGDVHIYPSGETVYARTAQATEYVVIQLAPNVLSAAASELGSPVKLTGFRGGRDIQVERIATLFEAELRSGSSSGRLYGESLGMALAAHVMQHDSEGRSNPPEHKGGLPGRTLKTALEYIHAHTTQDIPLQALANVMHMSVFHFCRLFKQSTGFTPHQYLLHLRMEEAKRLLRSSNLNIAEIGQQVGFDDQSHFGATFRKVTGMTPNCWRRAA